MMGNHTDTRTLKRFPDSPPRVSRRLRFPILCMLAIDLALTALLLVIFTTPLSAHYPGAPIQSPHAPASPTLETVNLPMGSAAPSKAPVSHRQAVPVHSVAPTTPKPSKRHTAAPTTSLPTVAKSPIPTDPSPTDSGD